MEALGADLVRDGSGVPPRHAQDALRLPPIAPDAVMLPRTTAEVSAALRHCHAAGLRVVVQGGLTGLAGGAHPVAGEVALSLERLSGIEEIDVDCATMTVRAGTPLQVAQDAAEAAGFMLGIDLGSRGSCTVGGVISTNAGGNHVVRYGMTRRHVLGLEIVLADGTVVTRLNKMAKNNAGLDWTQMFIGAEGTLGVVTRAVLALQPRPLGIRTALVAVSGFTAALTLLRRGEQALPGGWLTFEGMWREFLDLAIDVVHVSPPMPRGADLWLLLEATTGPDDATLDCLLEDAMDQGLVLDAVLAESEAQRHGIWALRESPYEYATYLPDVLGFDVSVPRGRMQHVVDAIRSDAAAQFPDVRIGLFGHIGDCNLHVVAVMPDGMARKPEIEALVYGIVAGQDGSVSAEHGIGQAKRAWLHLSRTPEELALLRGLKGLLDPKGILNRNRVMEEVH